MADRPLFVVVLPLTTETQVHAKDANAAGVYELISDASMPRSVAAASALESFHTRVAISYPEDFIIKVVDPLIRRVVEPGEADQALVLPCKKVSSVVRGWIANLVDGVEPIAETSGYMKTTLFVVAVPLRPREELHPFDLSVRGVYTVSGIDRTLTDAVKAESALQSFHKTVTPEVLKDFQITVVDGVANKVLETGAECESHDFYCRKLHAGISSDLLALVGAPVIDGRPTSEPAATRRKEDDLSPGF